MTSNDKPTPKINGSTNRIRGGLNINSDSKSSDDQLIQSANNKDNPNSHENKNLENERVFSHFLYKMIKHFETFIALLAQLHEKYAKDDKSRDEVKQEEEREAFLLSMQSMDNQKNKNMIVLKNEQMRLTEILKNRLETIKSYIKNSINFLGRKIEDSKVKLIYLKNAISKIKNDYFNLLDKFFNANVGNWRIEIQGLNQQGYIDINNDEIRNIGKRIMELSTSENPPFDRAEAIDKVAAEYIKRQFGGATVKNLEINRVIQGLSDKIKEHIHQQPEYTNLQKMGDDINELHSQVTRVENEKSIYENMLNKLDKAAISIDSCIDRLNVISTDGVKITETVHMKELDKIEKKIEDGLADILNESKSLNIDLFANDKLSEEVTEDNHPRPAMK